MPFCPKCKYEYNQTVSTCPDCGEKLVAVLPPKLDVFDIDLAKEYKEWVLIATLTSQQYAEMCLEGLRSKDIPAILHSGTGHFGLLGQMGISSYRPVEGYYKLIVPKEFAEDARNEAQIILGDQWETFGAK